MIDEALISDIARYVSEADGITAMVLSKRLGISLDKTRRLIEKAEGYGLVKRYPPNGKTTVVVTPERCAYLLADRIKRNREYYRAAQRKHREAKPVEVEADDDGSVDSWPIKRAWIAAEGAPMPQTVGVSSVFQWAGA